MTGRALFATLLLLTTHCYAQKTKFFQHEGFDSCTPCNPDMQMQDCGPFLTKCRSSHLVFSTCNKAVPTNPAGVQEPKDGNAYGGFSALSSLKNDTDYRGEKYIFLNREYIAFRLVTALVKNARYQLVFYISLTEESSFAAPAMSVCISSNTPEQFKRLIGALKEETTMYKIDSSEILSDRTNWQRVVIPFVATGGEQYVTIGVFARGISRKLYNKINFDSAVKRSGAYYYVDDITVESI